MSFPPDMPYANQPLPYAPPPRGRPGILTAVGVISIVVAAISVTQTKPVARVRPICDQNRA